MSHSVTSFDVPLALLKRLDMTELSSSLMLFLATFFIALFTSKVTSSLFFLFFSSEYLEVSCFYFESTFLL